MLVTGTHPATYTVDLLDWRTGWKVKGAAVLTGPATGRTGLADLPVFTEDAPGLALVDMVDGAPIVLGFLHNRLSSMRFDDGRLVFKHDSDVYVSLGRDGELEIYHPSGAMIRIGEVTAHEDLAGKDHDKLWGLTKNLGKTINITVVTNGAVAVLSESLTHNGVNVGATHVHTNVQSGSDDTGPPAS